MDGFPNPVLVSQNGPVQQQQQHQADPNALHGVLVGLAQPWPVSTVSGENELGQSLRLPSLPPAVL